MTTPLPHVFVVPGDVTHFAADAWLLPTDRTLHITEGWYESVPGLRAAMDAIGNEADGFRAEHDPCKWVSMPRRFASRCETDDGTRWSLPSGAREKSAAPVAAQIRSGRAPAGHRRPRRPISSSRWAEGIAEGREAASG